MFARADNIKKENCKLSFDISWKGSWRNDVNCDGVYIFAKYREKDSYEYKSVRLKDRSEGEFDYSDKSPSGFSVKSNELGIYVPYTQLGAFVFPAEECRDKEQNGKVTLLCEDFDAEDIKVFTVEMVYIPEGGHYVGDPKNGISKGGTLKNCFYQYPDKGAYYIDSEKEIKFAPEEDCLYCDMDTDNARQEKTPFVIPEKFPKGFKAMWYMKYSLSSEQYVMFLNCLTREQQKTHVTADISGENIENYYILTNTNEETLRNAVYCRKTGNDVNKPLKVYTSAPFRACNAIAYRDIAAFACFSGLRLITELEFEKACRGTAEAVAGEFAWGTTNIGRVFNFIGADGSGTEIPLSEGAGKLSNCNFGEGIAPFEREFKKIPDNPGWIGPVSTGLFERNEILEGYTERKCKGASYYGVMELCGNVWENLVSVGRSEGRKYEGTHGNGILDEHGNHTMQDWPDSETGIGNGVRGGVFVSPNPEYVRMALRVFAAHTKAQRGFNCGLRVGF